MKLIVKKIIFVALVLIGAVSGVFAQRSAINYGDVYFESFEYKLAIKSYKEALIKITDPEKRQYIYGQIARCLQYLSQYVQAEEYFELMVSSGEYVDPELLIDYGTILKLNGKYALAKKQFLQYNKLAASSNANRLIQSVDWAMQNENTIHNSYRIFLTNLDISGQSLGYCYYGKGLIYCHGRNKPRLGEGKRAVFDIDYSISENNLEFVGRNNFFSKIELGMNEISPSLNSKETELFFAANATQLRKGVTGKKRLQVDAYGISNFKLYVATQQDATFQNVRELPFNANEYNYIHPCILSDGKTLIFASDMPGGYGGFDLYKVSRSVDSVWGNPVNMGPEVNTAENELFPWVSGIQLYFSSKGFNGYGGYDIYTAELNTELNPSDLKNMGMPVNSFRDDLAFITKDSGATGYFSSNRGREDGEDQVYFFREGQSAKLGLKVVKSIVDTSVLKVIFPDSLSHPLAASVPPQKLIAVPASTTQKVAESQVQQTDVSLVTNKKVVVSSQPVVAPNTNVQTKIPAVKQEQQVAMKEQVIPKHAVSSVQVEKKLPPILFKLNDASLTPQQVLSADSAIAILEKLPTLVVFISAFTDSRGSTSYNIMLSNRRANAVKEYMIQNGISASRIRTKGFGEKQLLNGCSDGVTCTEDQHAINRRVELVITGAN
jgi:outer membrane protein OmpA-like peptidoglycan-associated protein/tetratricopeptide (TPR) repeat protein